MSSYYTITGAYTGRTHLVQVVDDEPSYMAVVRVPGQWSGFIGNVSYCPRDGRRIRRRTFRGLQRAARRYVKTHERNKRRRDTRAVSIRALEGTE